MFRRTEGDWSLGVSDDCLRRRLPATSSSAYTRMSYRPSSMPRTVRFVSAIGRISACHIQEPSIPVSFWHSGTCGRLSNTHVMCDDRRAASSTGSWITTSLLVCVTGKISKALLLVLEANFAQAKAAGKNPVWTSNIERMAWLYRPMSYVWDAKAIHRENHP